jgi:hypothetical protein
VVEPPAGGSRDGLAVQLAAALELNRLRVAAGLGGVILTSADLKLNAAATAVGLVVDDPHLRT